MRIRDNYGHEVYEGITVLNPEIMDEYTDASKELFEYVVECITRCNWYEYNGKLYIEESDAFVLSLPFDDDETIWWHEDDTEYIEVGFITRNLKRWNAEDGFYHA